MEPDLVIRGDVVRCPCLYVWRRDGLALYVGMSRHGFNRAFTQHHEHLRAMLRTDHLEVYLCPGMDPAALRKAEAQLIDQLEPSLNGRRRQYMLEHRPEPDRIAPDPYPHFKR